MKSIRVEVKDEQHRLLKGILAAQGLSISDWIREQITIKLRGKK